MAANKNVNVSMPIQAWQLGTGPASIPFFHYDEDTGTRSLMPLKTSKTKDS